MTTPRRRDAASTRQLLLDAARRRFAADGYSATSVRDIAGDAGVNVALISRYFTSKEGLFRECLRDTGDDLRRSVTEGLTVADAPRIIAEKLAGPPSTQFPNRLLLLLRTSGDEAAERIRLDILTSFAERLAAVSGDVSDRSLLNAQLVIATALGIVILRAAGVQPLAGADEEKLTEPLHHLITALLGRNGA
ncbi:MULTISPECIES: TetR/AcrR family transcriptional regulator [Actinoplanes]|uniref:TetR/AcrR family transcriptional regulator n=1 Tax=Actinoplanes TaxID=1865 RepID=UPI001FDF5C43|nr:MULTISPECIES: TetR/AcrR family transcriptional regulator [Actinoplanes]